ncbi:MAG: hypothetical protein MUD01_19255 [Chloroflexaceae bacterium]|jgi:hypothetical protein|nr:hypothetical protein [Chloroflexaceae bacterium]
MTQRRKLLYGLLIGLGLVVMLQIGLVAGVLAGPLFGTSRLPWANNIAAAAAPVAADASEAEYHRGIYDICRSAMQGSVEDCLKLVDRTRQQQWFQEGSPGWAWHAALPGEGRAEE